MGEEGADPGRLAQIGRWVKGLFCRTKAAPKNALADTSNLAKPLGRGSTGRTGAANLNEQLAMKQAMSDPAGGLQLRNVTMTDPRWPASDGWVKMSQRINGTEVHYVRNTITGAVDDFKFK